MVKIIRKITGPQQRALDWLNANGGSGTFDQSGCTIKAGALSITYKRDVWVALRDAQRIEFFNEGTAVTPFGGVRVLKP